VRRKKRETVVRTKAITKEGGREKTTRQIRLILGRRLATNVIKRGPTNLGIEGGWSVGQERRGRRQNFFRSEAEGGHGVGIFLIMGEGTKSLGVKRSREPERI